MRTTTYSHHGAEKALPADIVQEVQDVLGGLRMPIVQYSASRIRNAITEQLQGRGWSGRVRLDPDTKISVTSMKQRVALCLQTGNMARFYADLLKLQLPFTKGAIEGAMLITPTQAAASSLGSNIANFDRLTRELPVFREIITVPLLVVGFEE